MAEYCVSNPAWNFRFFGVFANLPRPAALWASMYSLG